MGTRHLISVQTGGGIQSGTVWTMGWLSRRARR